MKISKVASILLALGAGIFIGCGGGGGSSSNLTTSSASTISKTTTGKVVDGYLYNVKVCYEGTNLCTTTNTNLELIGEAFQVGDRNNWWKKHIIDPSKLFV